MCDLFSNKQQSQTTQQNTSNQSGQSNTQGNIWNQISPFLNQYLQQYSPSNLSSTGTPNQYQTEAGSNQSTIASGDQLQPGVSASSNIATNGLTPSQISQYMSPYISNVVNPTIAAQNIQNQQGLSNLRGNQAAQGALGNNTGSEAAYLAGVQPAQEATIANLYNQGYNTAANTAATSAGLQLQGAGQLGNLTNVGSNANNTLYNIGQGLFQTGLTPYTLLNQGVQGLSGLSGIAGSNTQTSGSGTTTGNSNTNQSSSPSLGSILLGGLGTVLSGFEHGGSVHGDKPKVEPFHEKVATSFDILHKLKKKAQGGNVGHYDDGGSVGEPILTGWEPTVTPSPSVQPFSTQKMGSSLVNMANNLSGTDAAPVMPLNSYGVAPGQAGRAIQGFSSLMHDIYSLPRYDDGGSVFSGVTDALPSMDTVKSYLPSYDTGVWAGDKPSSMQRFGAALAQIGNGPFAPFGKAVMDQQAMRYKDLEAQREAQRLGLQSQQIGLEAAKNPAEIEALKAQAAAARTNADKQFLLDIEKQKMEYAKELQLQQMQNQYKMVNGILNPGASVPASTPGVPAIGEVQDGYRFKGGNPADQNSWEPAQ